MHLLAKIDEFGRPAWIALMILTFWLFWPLGLATLAFAGFSGRLRRWREEGPGRWYNTRDGNGGCGQAWGRTWGRAAQSSGNAAFDEYRAETIKRLEEEQNEFKAYLERLRKAKDKQEFDQFMEERRRVRPAETV